MSNKAKIDATRAHIDAETMAAWADRALPADEAAAVELHLSNCDRCQEILAAFVRSGPMTGAVVLPFWTRRPVQWSAAGLAAAAAIVAMIWIGRPPAAPTPESIVASNSVTQEASPTPTPAALDRLQDKSATPPAELKKEKPSSLESARQERRRDSATRALDDKAVVNQTAAKKTEGRTAGIVVAEPPPVARPVVAAPPPAPVASAPPPPAPVAAPPPAAAAGSAAVAPPFGATRQASEAVVMDAISALPIIEIAAPDPNPSAMRSMAGAGGRGGGATTNVLSQSPGATRWRIVGGTRVERTVDAGVTWTALPIAPAITTRLVAGVATSPLNCWMVGRDGVVLVTSDGRTFRRVSVPEVVHLTGVTATDAMRATVTAIDGRTFSTADGGLTWK